DGAAGRTIRVTILKEPQILCSLPAVSVFRIVRWFRYSWAWCGRPHPTLEFIQGSTLFLLPSTHHATVSPLLDHCDVRKNRQT
ncbi:MAG: hypothetical protein ABW138_17425, partial [Candidatus Thiodiazotropha sp. 4PDIVS1]